MGYGILDQTIPFICSSGVCMVGLLFDEHLALLCSVFSSSLSIIAAFLLFRYKSLDVKNILMETISHHILPQMLASPLWVDLDNLLKDYLKFMDDHFRESADLTFLAYRHRNYSKV